MRTLFWYSIRVCLLALTMTKRCCSCKRPYEKVMVFFSDTKFTTVEQCPFLALSVRMTESKKKPNQSKITANPMHTSFTHNLSSSHQCTLFKSNTTQQWSLFKHHIPPLHSESTTLMSGGWNDQSKIIPDWMNTSKTTALFPKLMNSPLKKHKFKFLSDPHHIMYIEAFFQMKSSGSNTFNMLHIQIIVMTLFFMCDQY